MQNSMEMVYFSNNNSSNSNDIDSKRTLKFCLICGNFSKSKFYNAQSCESCKQFFRRIIVKQVEFFCPIDGNCDFMKNKCRGCRLDKCLQIGMKPINVQMERTEIFDDFLERLEQRRKNILAQKVVENIQKMNANNNSNYCDKIVIRPIANIFDWESYGYFCHIISAHNRIWGQFVDIPDEYLNKFSKIEEIIEGNESILSESFPAVNLKNLINKISDQFQFNLKCNKMFDDVGTLDKNFMVSHPQMRRAHAIFMLLMVGILKAMPAFKKITFQDKLILAREIGHSINHFILAYNSAKMGLTEMVAPPGSLATKIVCTYKNDPKILHLSKKAFGSPVEAFHQIPMLEQEEYALMLAILYSNPSISGLSECAKCVLEEEQSKYSRLLIQYLQMKLGPEKGARRYAECIQLSASAIKAVHNFNLLQTYIEVFKSGEDCHAGVQPECLKILLP